MSEPTKYPILFRKQIHASFSGMSSEDVWLERVVILPVPPCIGLEVSYDDWNATITSLHADLESGIVEAFTEDDKEIYNGLLNSEPYRPLKEIVKEWVKSGWKVEKK
jgi:hypothetical protein